MRRLAMLVVLSCSAMAQPTLYVQNAAAVTPDTDGYRAAPRSLVKVGILWQLDGSVETIDPSTASLTIESVAGGLQQEATILDSLTPLSVLAALPEDLPLGPATFRLDFDDGQTVSAEVEIVSTDLALFTIGSGTAPALAQNVETSGEVQVNGLTHPVRPGDYLVLWGTGLGLIPQEELRVLVGDHSVPVLYAGPAPSFPGLDQINVFVPGDTEIPDGCYVPLVVEIGSHQSNHTTVTKVAGDGPCEHPLGLTDDQVAKLDQGGQVPFGSITLSRFLGPDTAAGTVTDGLLRQESAQASFFDMDAADIAVRSRSQETSPEFGCKVNRTLGTTVMGFRISGTVSVGDRLTIFGPEGQSVDLLPQSEYLHLFYGHDFEDSPTVSVPSDLEPPFFTGGDWQIYAPGSDEVESFRVDLQLPPPISLSNFSELQTIDRNQDLTITWATDGYQASDTLSLTLYGSSSVVDGYETTTGSVIVSCSAAAVDGEVTIPSDMLSEFDSASPPVVPYPTLYVRIGGPPEEESMFSVPLADGGVMPGQVSYSWGLLSPVTIR